MSSNGVSEDDNDDTDIHIVLTISTKWRPSNLLYTLPSLKTGTKYIVGDASSMQVILVSIFVEHQILASIECNSKEYETRQSLVMLKQFTTMRIVTLKGYVDIHEE